MKINHIELLNVGDGHDIVIETVQLSEGISLKVYDQKDAELIIEGGREKVEIPFNWNAKAQAMVERINDLKAIELFGLIRAV